MRASLLKVISSLLQPAYALQHAVEVVRWGIQVLLEGLLTPKFSITIVAVEVVLWGVQVLLESLGSAKGAVARNAAVVHLW